jgi:uncharacterized protein (TIGR02145 family)
MKKPLFLTVVLALMLQVTSFGQSIKLNNQGDPGSAMLEVSSTSKGVLIPNVSLTGSTDATTIVLPAVSLLVYNTASVSDVIPGYYYNSGTAISPVWTRLSTGTSTGTAGDGSETKVTPGTNVTITGSGTQASPYIVNATEVDGDVTNEIQDLSISGNILKITLNATAIDLSPYLDNTDNQTLAEILASNTSAGSKNITSLADPVDSQDAATKAYVDAKTITGTAAGQLQYWNGSAWVAIEPTVNTQAILKMIDGVPTWAGGYTVPDAPTIGTATAGAGQATITYDVPGSNGGATITSYTATSSSPDGIAGTVTQATSGTITVLGLTPGTAYTFTLTATNAAGISLASAVSNAVTPFTIPDAPTIGTATAGAGQATITYDAPGSNGGATITSYTATSFPGGITGTVTQATSGTITVMGLTPRTEYTFTVTATNAAGNSVASAVSNAVVTPFTVPDAPIIGTAIAGAGRATITYDAPGSNGGAAITSYTATSSSPDGIAGTITQATSGTITVLGLTNGTAYTFTVTATNAVGNSVASAVSNAVTPFTIPDAPTIGTATAGGGQATITYGAPGSNGGAAITIYTATSSPDGITGTITQATSGTITVLGLTPGTAYTFTLTATNAAGISLASTASNSVTPDLPSVTIGNQIWTSKNLDVSTYRDGTAIPKVVGDATWYTLTTGAYCYYKNDSATYAAIYGKLYNWYAVAGIHDNDPNTANKTLAPEGWHLPTNWEWTTLTDHLELFGTSPSNGGRRDDAGGQMKESGLAHWVSPNTGATNESGFAGLPGGFRSVSGSSYYIGLEGYWWSSTEYDTSDARYLNLHFSTDDVDRDFYDKGSGFSVRCLRD